MQIQSEPVYGEAVPFFVTFLYVRRILFRWGFVPLTSLSAGGFSVRIVLDDCGTPGVRVLDESFAFGDKSCASDRSRSQHHRRNGHTPCRHDGRQAHRENREHAQRTLQPSPAPFVICISM